MRKSLIRLGLALPLLLLATAAETQSDLCATCISIRVGRPIVIRGPSGPKGDETDAALSVIRLPDGRFRAFTGNSITYAVDGAAPWDLGGPARPVLGPGPRGSASECGNWITSIIPDRDRLIGLIHNEQACSYRDDQTHKSMSVGVSSDHGLNWKVLGPILRGTDAPQKGKGSGEGDCTAIDGGDGYLYAYCLRVADWATIVARAPLADPSRFFKWSGAGWNAAGIGGMAAALAGAPGSSVAYWTTGKMVVALATRGSVRLSLSADKLQFAAIPDPLILYDSDSWKRPGPTDLYGYPSLVGEQGFNRLSDHFYLTYMYLPPGTDFSQRFLVLHDMWMTKSAAPIAPQVGVALSRWQKPGLLWTTTGPAIEDGDRLRYRFDRELGYLMSAPGPAPSVKLAECVSEAGRERDYVLSEDGSCAREGFRRLRSAGFVYREERPGTIPLYRCIAAKGFHFASIDKNCEALGSAERLLGFMLAK
jgi:hypothetical protein